MRARDVTDLLLLAALWGGSFLFIRVAVPQFGPFPLMALRTGIGALCLLPFVLMAGSLGDLRRYGARLFIIGILNAALPFVMFGYAMLTMSAGFTSILNATVPFWGALVAFFWQGERLGPWRIAGLALGFCGVLVLVWGRVSFGAGGFGLPIAAVLLATLSYAVAASATRVYLSQVGTLANAAGSLLGAALALSPLAVMYWPQQSPDLLAWSCALLVGVLSTGLAYVLYFRLIANIGSTGAITVTFLVPMFAVLWGGLFLDESITLNMIAGAAVILAGTALTTGLIDPGRRLIRTAAAKPARRAVR
ncbi:MAG: DMT family transporter [Burkholderiales bacterium]|nr:DMT family transporter [Burkholderiales bacterium]